MANDKKLFSMMKEQLFSAVIGDVMDGMGLYQQFLPPQIRPLDNEMIVVGRAMPVLETDTYGEISTANTNAVMQQPFGLMLEALDNLKVDEVYICSGSSPKYALWGELMSTRAKKLGAAGVVLDGYTRDSWGTLAINFPTFSYGSYAQDQGVRGKVIDYRCIIEIKGVIVKPGDIVYGDRDGVCIIPQSQEGEIIQKAIEKARGEKLVLKAIQSGMSACQAFEKYGIM